jgi:hypothetical protein
VTILNLSLSTLSELNNDSKRLQNSVNNIANGSKGLNVDITEAIENQLISKVAIQANVNVIKASDKILGIILDTKS